MLRGGVVNFEERLLRIGLPQEHARLFSHRRSYAETRMEELSRRLSDARAITGYPDLTIFAAGSYARREASEYSDVDLFFIVDDREGDAVDHPRLREVKIMSAVIEATEVGMRLPAPSNDGEFLKILSLKDILSHLGGNQDDVRNYFTTRMLMLLESMPLVNSNTYDACVEAMVDTYLRDYDLHQDNFHPTFVVNDVLRFWKTLCLNYENRRNQKDDAKKLKQKIRNFKLGFSRLMTCFATVAVLANYDKVTREEMIALFKMPPLDRLLFLVERRPVAMKHLKSSLTEYHWFLTKTASTTEQLETYFQDKVNRTEAFDHARKFGDEIFGVVREVAEASGTMRYLVV